MKLKDWLKENRGAFGDSDLRFLVKEVFNKDLSTVVLENTYINPERRQYLDEIKELALSGVPLAYVLGKEIFFGFEFKVNNDALIPRPETELAVEKALEIISEGNTNSVLDLGCGCGNIAISISKSTNKTLAIVASDVSQKALEVARQNIEFHNVDIKLVNSDLFKAFRGEKFDLIVSNPPYVEDANIKGSLLHEPHVALSGKEDGFYFAEKILSQAKEYLTEGGSLIVEMGHKHKELTDVLLGEISWYKKIEWVKDYPGHFRTLVLRT